MGYFSRKLRRGRWRDAIRDTHERSVAEGWWERWEDAVPPVDRQRWYLRFSVPDVHADSGSRSGVFAAAYDVLREPGLDRGLHDGLRHVMTWFEENLRPKDPGRAAAIFFFKSDSAACMRHIWDLVGLLKAAGLQPQMVKLRRPGLIVFEDDDQVAAVPERRDAGR